MPRRPPSVKLNKISVFIVYLYDSAVICRQHIWLIVNKSRKHVNSSILIICHMNFALSLGSLSLVSLQLAKFTNFCQNNIIQDLPCVGRNNNSYSIVGSNPLLLHAPSNDTTISSISVSSLLCRNVLTR